MLLLMLSGCLTSTDTRPVQVFQPPPLFPPQVPMQTGDYAAFLAENESTIQGCKEPEHCAVALFNLGFVYCYPKSPYYSPPKGMKYIEDLIKGAPQSPWAYQAQVWLDTMKKKSSTEVKKRPLREDAKSRETAVSRQEGEAAPEGSKQQAETAQENDWEADRQRLEEELRAREDTIKDLKAQIERSRQIDIEIEKKERGLLY